jgi:hypothetical protein
MAIPVRKTSDGEDEPRSLFPPSIRRWVFAGLVAVIGGATYLVAVRGTTILYDLRDAVAAICF